MTNNICNKAEILQTLVELGVSVDTESKLYQKLRDKYLPYEDLIKVKQISVTL